MGISDIKAKVKRVGFWAAHRYFARMGVPLDVVCIALGYRVLTAR